MIAPPLLSAGRPSFGFALVGRTTHKEPFEMSAACRKGRTGPRAASHTPPGASGDAALALPARRPGHRRDGRPLSILNQAAAREHQGREPAVDHRHSSRQDHARPRYPVRLAAVLPAPGAGLTRPDREQEFACAKRDPRPCNAARMWRIALSRRPQQQAEPSPRGCERAKTARDR
jgi:hypothetical protein